MQRLQKGMDVMINNTDLITNIMKIQRIAECCRVNSIYFPE